MKDGGPAFPNLEGFDDQSLPSNVNGHYLRLDHSGMSLRDWFAGQALAGMLASKEDFADHADIASMSDTYGSMAARYAYGYADYMLAQREK